MKYRKKESSDSWEYYEDGNKQRCTDYLIMNEYDEDYEYEIYELSKTGFVMGVLYSDES